MTREERLRILGPAVVAEIHRQVDAAPPPPPELIARLRLILTQPAGRRQTESEPAA